MPSAVFDPRSPGDQAFLNTSLATATKSTSKRSGDDSSKNASLATSAAKYVPQHPGDQNFA